MDVNQSTRPTSSTDNLQTIVFMLVDSLDRALRTNGLDGVFVRPLIEDDQDLLLYRTAPTASDNSLATAV